MVRGAIVMAAMLTATSIGGAKPAIAAIRLAPLFSDHMVLQREKPLTIWGSGSPGEDVVVQLGDDRAQVRVADDGRWSVQLPPQIPGGPRTLTVSGSTTIELKDVLIGDVWLASGQSNMEFTVHETSTAERDLAGPFDPQLRLFKVPKQAAFAPKQTLPEAHWAIDSQDAAKDFSAVAYLLGRRLRTRLGVPIGLVQSTWGGTSAEAWTSRGELAKIPEFADDVEKLTKATSEEQAAAESYVHARDAFMAKQGLTDRGMTGDVAAWAAPSFDDAAWTNADLPRPDPAWGNDFGGFSGTIWYRRSIDIPGSGVGAPLEISLGDVFEKGQLFFNGVAVPRTGKAYQAVYAVPAAQVVAGRAVLAFRVTGASGFVMVSGETSRFYARGHGFEVPLTGAWRAQPAADLSGFPKVTTLSPYLTTQGPTTLFNGMIAPLLPATLKGVLWYQGENNVGAAVTYSRLFPAMIVDWRAHFGQELPFLFVQLAGFGPESKRLGYSPIAELREAQTAALTLPATGFATAVDVGNAIDVHPTNKAEVARRLELVAARVAYGLPVEDRGPTFSSMKVEGRQVRIRFIHSDRALATRSGTSSVGGFLIAGEDGAFHRAAGRIDGDSVLIDTPAGLTVKALRYNWADTPSGDLIGKSGLPAPPFRTERP